MATPNNEDGPNIQYVTKDTPLEHIIAHMKRDGFVIVRELVTPADVDQAYAEVHPRLEQWPRWDGTFFPKETQRTPNLVSISPTYTRTQMMNPLFQQLCDHFLTTRSWNWWGDERTESVSRPCLSSTSALRVGPGARAQPLHRDDYVNHNYIVESDTFDYRQQIAMTMLVAGSKVTKENGGTQLIPGSHLWGNDRPTAPPLSSCVHARMEKGDALILFSSVYHGGGHNTTTDDHRLVFTTCVIRGILRQEENQYLAVPMDRVREYDRETQRFIGYSMSDPVCGHADEVDPIYLVRPEELDKTKSIHF
ncbi:hypothetical protein BJY04DRAFT_31832 [Aspergillus karnatakaensis]|uniref:phytanoyl-CoA dioxygenase family protein n=1 Tax=Aspergillus karnatakaensis TaxID=1810916 RepID=UPI003CCCF4C2